jgi:DNA replication protein DnaC
MLEPIAKFLPPSATELPSREEAARIIEQARQREAELAKQGSAERAVAAAAARRAARESTWAACGIPPRFADANLDAWQAELPEQQRVQRILQRYVAEFDAVRSKGTSLLMRGTIGSGKSTLGCALCNAIAAAGYSAMYVHQVAKLFRQVKEAFAPGAAKPASEVMAAFKRPDLLVLDEVGVQFGGKTEQQLLTELVDDRYGDHKPTVLITNLESAELSDLLEPRAVDRLREHGRTLHFGWPSFRAARATEAQR